VIDVEETALRAFEQNLAAVATLFFQHAPRRLGVGQNFRRDRDQLRLQRSGIDIGELQPRTERRVMREQAIDLPIQRIGIGEIVDANGAAADLILVGRADAAAGGADARAARGGFARDIQFAVQRQDQATIVRQHKLFGIHRHALRSELGDLLKQRERIDDNAIADDRALALHQARRQQRELVSRVAHHQRVTGIVAALEAHDDIGAMAEPIDDLAFALVAPLGADHDDGYAHGIESGYGAAPARITARALRQALGARALLADSRGAF